MCDGFFLFFIILYVGCFAFVSACVVCVPDGYKGQEIVPSTLKLEL